MSVNGKSEPAPAAMGVLTIAPFGAPAVAGALRDELRRLSPSDGRPIVNCLQLDADLEIAEANAQVGVTLPEMPRLRGPKRFVARLVVKGIFFLARVITNRQRQFNSSVLGCLRGLTAHVRGREDEQSRLDHLEASLAGQAVRIRALEEALTAAHAWRIGPAREAARSRPAA
ncbi:MAG TPA: hypothetical protein VKA46_05385 [Gemmataceae bacterium]|nr:hypothetical protein [Gemmataceae bacterium]